MATPRLDIFFVLAVLLGVCGCNESYLRRRLLDNDNTADHDTADHDTAAVSGISVEQPAPVGGARHPRWN